MKVKKFDNLWTMGLILCGAILVLLYVAKIFFPEWVVGVAEIPSVVSFGQYIDAHKWAFDLFNFSICYIGMYIFSCACCRVKYLAAKQNAIIIGSIVVLELVRVYLPNIHTPYNYVYLALTPFLVMLPKKAISRETFISMIVCFSIDIMAQAVSLQIRDIIILTTCVNSATLVILLIDTWLWRWLLYMFFNFKKEV